MTTCEPPPFLDALQVTDAPAKITTDPIVQMRGIVKRFPGVVANARVDFDVLPGEIHALLGENGAGKTTLMNILYGLYAADEGEIFLKGQSVSFHSSPGCHRQWSGHGAPTLHAGADHQCGRQHRARAEIASRTPDGEFQDGQSAVWKRSPNSTDWQSIRRWKCGNCRWGNNSGSRY